MANEKMENRSTHILLLRHGQTQANAEGRLQGHLQMSLNLAGIRQANLLASRLAGYSPAIDAIVSSDLNRAMETAAPIATACGLGITTDAAWRERSFGLLEGKPIGDRKMWEVASGDFDPPGAEPSADVYQRIHGALRKIPDDFSDHQCIAVITHGGPIRTVVKMLADGRLPLTRKHDPITILPILNCSILHLIARRYPEGFRWKVEAYNDIAHLNDL